MFLVVGLGNPGPEYARNRHNIGFMAVDGIVRRHSFGSWRGKYQGEMSEGEIAGERVLALKPMTYMNRSGQSVAACAKFLKIPPERVIVLHDEIELPPGKLRVKKGGGHAGHNGLRDIDAHVGKDYWRIRLGVGRPHDKAQVHDWVLGDFAKSEQDGLDKLLDAVADHLPLMIKGDESGFMNRVTSATRPPQPKKEKAPAAAPTKGAAAQTKSAAAKDAPPSAAPAETSAPSRTPSTALADALRKAFRRDTD